MQTDGNDGLILVPSGETENVTSGNVETSVYKKQNRNDEESKTSKSSPSISSKSKSIKKTKHEYY